MNTTPKLGAPASALIFAIASIAATFAMAWAAMAYLFDRFTQP